MGKWRYRSTFWEVNGKVHVSTHSTQLKEQRHPYYGVMGDPRDGLNSVTKKNILLCPEPNLCVPACSLVTTLTELVTLIRTVYDVY